MKKLIYAAMLLLGLSMTTTCFAQNTKYDQLLKKKRQQLTEDLANSRFDWIYGTWKLDFLNEIVIIEKDYVYHDESRNSKEPFNLHYELEDPYNEDLDYGVYLYICNIPVDEDNQLLYFADEFSIWPYEKISDVEEIDPDEIDFEEQEVYQIVEQMPSFPGGEQKLSEFIANSIQYPQEAQKTGIQGRVFVSFIVEPDGSVSNVKVQQGIGGGCDQEAIRVIKSMPKWTPGKQRGKAVRVSYMMPVFFKLQ